MQVLLNWRREVDEPLDVREAIPQLEYLAYAMCDRGVQQLRQDEILELFARMREEYANVHAARNREPDEFLKRLEARTGILVEAGHARHLGMLMPVYEFRHLTFQEYLAARALVDGRFPSRDPRQNLAAHVVPLAGRTIEMTFTEGGPKETEVVENWREALRLCAAICSDDDVDGVLLSILTPQVNDTSAVARARAILAALCLADEPNASDEVADQVLRTLAKQVAGQDGKGPVETGIDAAAMELAGTRWANALCAALGDEFCLREPHTRWNPGGMLAMVSAENADPDKAGLTNLLIEQTRRLCDEDEREAIRAALCVMHLSFRDKAQLIPGLVDILLKRLAGSAPMAHAAGWALGWLNGGYYTAYKDGIWQPKPGEMESLIVFVSNPKSDPYAVRYLTWILGREKVEHAVEPLILWLENPIADVRSTVASALGNIESEAAVASLIARLQDAEAQVRSTAAHGLAQGLERIDRMLLSRHLDGVVSFLDPCEPIGEAFAQKAASKLALTIEDVRARYEALADRFLLRLAWRSGQ